MALIPHCRIRGRQRKSSEVSQTPASVLIHSYQRKDGGGKRAKGSYGHCASPMAHEDVLFPRNQNGEGRRGGAQSERRD
jgi:hypothetical protein